MPRRRNGKLDKSLGEHKYIDNIEDREDGGTPGFLQSNENGLSHSAKRKKMGVQNIIDREHELVTYIFERLETYPTLIF